MKYQPYPLLFIPVYQDYIWGGTRITRVFDREPQPGITAESWEITDRPEGMSVVRNGPLRGRTLHDLLGEMGADLVGTAGRTDCFPLLVKILDATQDLSVQVHPDDAGAARVNGEPKTETWYMLNGEPGSVVYVGLKPGTDRDRFAKAVEAGDVEKLLASHPAEPGSVVYIQGGCVHAIGAGCMMLEVQQNSNTTYRIHDWGRVGTDGKPRELHIDRALEVINWELAAAMPAPGPVQDINGNSIRDLLTSPYFRIGELRLRRPMTLAGSERTFSILFVAEGAVTVTGGGEAARLGHGTSCLVPAAVASVDLLPESESRVVKITLE